MKILLTHEEWLETEIAALKTKLWEVQKKDVDDIQFWKAKYYKENEKYWVLWGEHANLKEKIRQDQQVADEQVRVAGEEILAGRWVISSRNPRWLDYKEGRKI